MKKIKIFLPIFLALVMCVTSIQPVRAVGTSGGNTEPTYYYNNNYNTEDALSGVTFNKVTNALVTGEDQNGYVQLQLATKDSHGTMTAALTGAESGSMLIEVDLATTDAGMPGSYFRIKDDSSNSSYELFFVQGDSIYATKTNYNNKQNAIATISKNGTFTKFGVALTADITGTIVSSDIYQYNTETDTWEYIGTNNGTGTNDPVGKKLSDPKNVSIQVRNDATTDQILLIDNLKASNTVFVAQKNDDKYATLEGAVNAAGVGDTITVLADASLTSAITSNANITINSGITLDLNGNTLDMGVNYLNSYGNVVDNSMGKTGVLKVADGKCVLSPTNSQMPIYNGTDGYVFTDITKQEAHSIATESETTIFNLIFRPFLGSEATIQNALSRDSNGIDDQFKVILRLTWENGTQDLVYTDTMVEAVYAANSGKAFYINASGVTSFEGLTITPMVVSDALGVTWSGSSFTEFSANEYKVVE